MKPLTYHDIEKSIYEEAQYYYDTGRSAKIGVMFKRWKQGVASPGDKYLSNLHNICRSPVMISGFIALRNSDAHWPMDDFVTWAEPLLYMRYFSVSVIFADIFK